MQAAVFGRCKPNPSPLDAIMEIAEPEALSRQARRKTEIASQLNKQIFASREHTHGTITSLLPQAYWPLFT
jgi:hypothetical protein